MPKKDNHVSRDWTIGGLERLDKGRKVDDRPEAGSEESHRDRRRSPRLPAVFPCQVEDMECEIRDISYAGLRFYSKKPLDPDTVKDLTLPVKDESGAERKLHVRANIRWCEQTSSGEYMVGAEVSAASREEEAEFLAFLFRSTARAYLDKEAKLIELEGYRSLVEMAANPILVIQDGKIAFSNQAAVEMFGFTSEELQGMEFNSLILSGPHATDSPSSLLTPIAEPPDPYYYTLQKANGGSVDVEIRSRSILYAHKMATLSILHDLTARKKFEQMLVQVERLKVLGELSAGIAHDVNNSLMSILGAVELIRSKGLDEHVTAALRTIKTAALDGATTIRRIQGFSRLRGEKNFVAFDVNQVVSDAKLFTRPKWKKEAEARGLTIGVQEVTAEEVVIQGNPSDVRQAVINLILNAVDAMPRGGQIELRTEADQETVTVLVRDTGTGIPAEIRDKIFDPFFSTKGERGSGLGLSTVYGIMAKHKGSVTVESAEGRGTTVRLLFPRAHPTEPGEVSEEDADRIPPRRVLVVDDDPKVLGFMADLLKSMGHTVITASTGEEGLRKFYADPPDIVLTDLSMPGITGVTLAKRVKAARPEVPVVLVTGWIQDIEPAELEEAGIGRVLTKPFGRQEMVSMMKAVAATVS
ncbi:MAG: response regulator [Candidatus Tectomicrobia bacterium]|nr:response regulator [Candidatus Tectomicrobia bacterium]